jgi:hypothetical protein
MSEWSFFTDRAGVPVCNVHDPGVRLRDIGATVDITEYSAYSIVTAGGYVAKDKDTDSCSSRHQIQTDVPLPEAIA